ncbi:MAG: hypothetical protein AAF081_19800, partial [Actinomycetota bacterium]
GRPTLLLLDEPTSSLDPTSERLVTESLAEIRGDTTIVAIAHRKSTVEQATVVVHVEHGQILAADGDPAAALDRALTVATGS